MNVKYLESLAERARLSFLPFDGVLGVGYGPKRVKGKETEQTAIIVFVEKKLPPARVKSGQLIPRTFQEFPTDVEEVRFESWRGKRDPTGLYEGRPMGQFLDWGKIHRLNVEQKRRKERGRQPPKRGGNPRNPPADLNTPVPEIRGDLFVIDDDGTLVYTTAGGEPIVDFVGAWNLFRAQFGDDYDFAVFYLDDQDPNFPDLGNFSQHIYVAAGDSGYGVGAVNNRGSWQSSARLLRMACHSWYSLRTMLHELGHQWLFFVNYRNSASGTEQTLLHESWDAAWSAGQKWYHPGRWADNDRSCMDYEHRDWMEVSPGVYRSLTIADADYNFCPLDQYLMGLLNPEAVASSRADPPAYPASGGDFQIINNPSLRPDGDYNATAVTITPQNIIWNEGARVPNRLNSQRVFHQATIAITFDRVQFANFLNNAETRRANHTPNWRRATSGRSVIDTSLLRNNINSLYIRDNTADTGGVFPGGAFWDSPDIFVRTTDDDPNLYLSPSIPNPTIHEKPKSNQDNWVYARVHNSSGTNYDNVTVNFYLANFKGFSGRDTAAQAVPRTEVIYPIDWHPESLIGSAVLNNVPAGGTAVAKVLWAQANIPPADWHPCLLVEVIPLGTSPSGLHHVWDNKKLAQKNIEIVYVPSSDYLFELPFTFGHKELEARYAFLEIEKHVETPAVEVWLEPRTALGEVHESAGRLFHRIPGLGLLPAEPAAEEEGLLVAFPRRTTIGLGCGTKQRDLLQVTFCDDTRLLIRPAGADLQRLGYLPIEGFALETGRAVTALRMLDPLRATLPVPLPLRTDHEMVLSLRVDGRKLERQVTLHLRQRDAERRVVGGIDIDLRPVR